MMTVLWEVMAFVLLVFNSKRKPQLLVLSAISDSHGMCKVQCKEGGCGKTACSLHTEKSTPVYFQSSAEYIE